MSPLIERLMAALRCLPGVGPKSAQRMALHLLQRDRAGARELVEVLGEALERVGHCRLCRTLTEGELCAICASERRDPSLLCVVETPADVVAIESGTGYRGRFFVLLGHLSPLDGVGPDEIGLDLLAERLAGGEVRELILATGTTPEGQATAHFIAELARGHALRVTRIAHGVPLGGDLELVDGGTLALALEGRAEV